MRLSANLRATVSSIKKKDRVFALGWPRYLSSPGRVKVLQLSISRCFCGCGGKGALCMGEWAWQSA